MALQIEINDLHIDALIDFYIQKLRTLHDEIAEKEKESKEINILIQRLKKGKNTPSENTDIQILTPILPYSEKWTWVKKIRFAIELKGKPLTTKEIVDALIDYELELMFERKKAVASISSMLSTKSGENKEFIKVESESGDFAYDINSNGKLELINKDQQEANPFE